MWEPLMTDQLYIIDIVVFEHPWQKLPTFFNVECHCSTQYIDFFLFKFCILNALQLEFGLCHGNCRKIKLYGFHISYPCTCFCPLLARSLFTVKSQFDLLSIVVNLVTFQTQLCVISYVLCNVIHVG